MKIKSYIINIVILLGFLPGAVFGAEIRFNPDKSSIPQSEPYAVTITIDTENQSINTVEGVILVSKELGDDIIISDSGSVVTYWVVRPAYDKASHSIKFTGAIPGGYTGQAGILFSVVLPPYNGGKIGSAMTIASLSGYINDGLGTPASIRGGQFTVGDGGSPIEKGLSDQLYIGNKKQDDVAPESFDPQVTRNDSMFGGRWFVVFSTTDKHSGIDHYEIQESLSGSIDKGRWKVANSPYLLEDQTLSSYIYITAVDRRGNERIIKVFPKQPRGFWHKYGNDFVAVLVVLVAVYGVVFYTKKKNKRSAQRKKYETSE